MKKKQSATGLFFSMFLRAIVVILAIVIVCLVVALIRSLIHNKGKNTDDTGTSVVSSTEIQDDPLITAKATEAVTEKPAPADVNHAIKIVVLNGTSTNGRGRYSPNDTGTGQRGENQRVQSLDREQAERRKTGSESNRDRESSSQDRRGEKDRNSRLSPPSKRVSRR